MQNVSHLLPFANPYLIFLPIFAVEKMIGMITKRHWFILSLAILTLCSCRHENEESKPQPQPQPIPDDIYGEMNVTFDWSQCEGQQPASMSLYLFNEENQSIPISFSNANGGKVQLLKGNYQAVAFNSDTETMKASGSSWADFTINVIPTTLEASARVFAGTRGIPKAVGTDEQEVIYEPEMLYTAADAGHEFKTTADDLRLIMKAATHNYTFTIDHVDNLSHVTSMSATLSGMASAFCPATGLPTQSTAIIPFTLEAEGSASLVGSVRCFGHCPEHSEEHKLVVYVQMDDGKKYYYSFDVTDALHDPNTPGGSEPGGTIDMELEIDGLPLPEPIEDSSNTGLNPEVDGWEEITIGIEL